MCVPGATEAVQLAMSIGKTAFEVSQQSRNNDYRSQVAITNAKNAQNEAKKQIQLGIEKSRNEKISGIQKANALLAQNASSNTDAFSQTNLQNFSDIKDISFSNADSIQDGYYAKADTYFSKANSYLYANKVNNQNYKNSLYKTALNSLGNYTQVALDWYSESEGL